MALDWPAMNYDAYGNPIKPKSSGVLVPVVLALLVSGGGNYWLWKERVRLSGEAFTATAKLAAADAVQKETAEKLANLEAERAALVEAKELAVKDAQAKATELTGKAEAAAVQAKAMAEAAGIKARAEALATNTDAVVAQQLAEAYPEIVRAASSSFDKVGNMVVLNGAQGIEDTLVKTITMGGSGFALAKQLIDSLATKTNEKPILESVPDETA